jgi:hypothetical protein
MNAASGKSTTKLRHSGWAMAKGLVAATFVVPIASYAVAFPLSRALGDIGDAGLVAYLTLGALGMPATTLMIVAVVVAVIGIPVWSLASALGWSGYRHAALGGGVSGALLGTIEMGLALGGGASWRPVAAEFTAILLVGTAAGLAARLAAGQPKLAVKV